MRLSGVLFLLILSCSVRAQQRIAMGGDKPRIAVLMFEGNFSGEEVFKEDGLPGFRQSATEEVSSSFVSLRRFTVLERSAIEKLVQEQNFQMGDLSDQNKVVSLGSMLGAQYIVKGNIQLNTTRNKDKKFRSSVHLDLSIVDVSTGKIVDQTTQINGRSDDKKNLSSNIAYDALKDAQPQIRSFIKKVFPVEGVIVKILEDESSNKKDKKKQLRVLISCGTQLGVESSDIFRIVLEEVLTIGGKSTTSFKDAGRVKVKTLRSDGNFSECDVLEGEKLIRSELDQNHELKVISYEN